MVVIVIFIIVIIIIVIIIIVINVILILIIINSIFAKIPLKIKSYGLSPTFAFVICCGWTRPGKFSHMWVLDPNPEIQNA